MAALLLLGAVATVLALAWSAMVIGLCAWDVWQQRDDPWGMTEAQLKRHLRRHAPNALA